MYQAKQLEQEKNKLKEGFMQKFQKSKNYMDKKHQIEMIINKLSEENIQLEYNIKKECQKQYEEQEANHKL